MLSVLSYATHAAQPYATDDAAILDQGACQIEVGRQVNRGNHELWLLPACNIIGDVELTLGKSQFNEADSMRSLYVLQGKGVFTADRDAPQAWGWVAGLRGHSRTVEDQRQLSSIYGALLYTRDFYRDTLLVHANIGVRSDRDERRNATTWGLAAEIKLGRVSLIAETFGDDRTHALHQAGVRMALIPEQLELDISRGAENGSRSDTRWWTLGLRITRKGLF